MCEYLDMLEARGREHGGKQGENRLARLISRLVKEKKYREMEEASNDSERRQELCRLHGVQ